MVRIKERYLLVNIVYAPDPVRAAKDNVPQCVVQHQPTLDRLTPQTLLKGIRAEVASLFGDYGSGALGGSISVKYISLATSTFILRCPRAHYQMLWSALTFMDRIPVRDGKPCIFRVVRVSGTIRKAEEEAIRQAKKLILAAKEESSGAKSTFASALQTQEPMSLDVTDESSDEDMADD
ncbi:Rpp14/Pop5 family-domain-containing protein [Dactylonectria estremocensis]|uniref:Ribonuclease P/MRP protein subunit POP5 n=1 Tax=Dactylonectria estremocensis TaxID=1079267 RepID=A0A9P9FEC3_9HYPO|nr:Rpp14/Pop5 family-domain-containing protein [Dactylonectria estremocensis]